MSRIASCLCVLALTGFAQDSKEKYKGPRPEKQDVPYLLHATNLVATESGEAVEEKRKEMIANVVKGAASNARTPMAEPIFLIAADKIQPEKLELYKMDVKNGQREVLMPGTAKKAKDRPRALRLKYERIEQGLYRVEANQWLDNGEYCLSPSGSNSVFCFQVY